MSLVETVRAITKEQMLELARTIEGELKAECPSDTGMARRSIHIEEEDDSHIFVGAHASFPPDGNDGGTHLYYADQGNRANGSDGRIHPTRKKALALKDGSIRASVRPYGGKHFIEAVANRHR